GHRRLPPQQLFDRARDDGGVLDDLAAMVGMGGEEGVEARQRVADGVEAGDQEQEADVEDLLAGQLVAVDLGGEEVAEDVLGRAALPLVEDLVEVLVDLLPSGPVERGAL